MIPVRRFARLFCVLCGIVFMPVVTYAENNCTGATYYDAENDTCIACPAGYDYNTDAGKTDISQCQIQCPAGTYINMNSNVPDTYTQLEYITGTGTQYINTQVSPTANFEFYLDAMILASGNTKPVFGTSNSSINSRTNSDTVLTSFLNSDGYLGGISTGGLNNKFYIGLSPHWMLYSTGIKYVNERTYTPSGTMTLLSYNGAKTGLVNARLYGAELYNGSTLTFHGVPVRRNSDNVLGVYDTVNNRFLTNAGTGTFTVGPDAVSTCTQVGRGYYAPEHIINYGDTDARNACPTNTITTVNNADDITDCYQTYSVSYVMNGGTPKQLPARYIYSVGHNILANDRATRDNSTFAGWCDDAELTQNCAKTRTISDTDSGDKTFYAKWTCNTGYHSNDAGTACVANTYTVTYDCGDGTGTPPADATATYAATFSPTMTTTCSNPGYALAGWKISDTDTVIQAGFTYNYAMDKTLIAQWVEFDPKFTVTTTNMAANTTFKFYMSAKGTFYVDWGDGAQTTIYRTSTTETLYSHTYTDAIGENGWKIQFSGVAATGAAYATSNTACLRFYGGTPNLIKNISGTLGTLFPGRGTASGYVPRFTNLFNGCTNLSGEISEDLFSGVTGVASYMFASVFANCKKLTGSIPGGLFNGITGPGQISQFFHTFYNCTGLTGTIPENLFSGITGPGQGYLFEKTFENCTGLKGFVPPELFSPTITNKNCAPNVFKGSGLLTACPCGTKQVITGFEPYWSSRVACAVVSTPNPGEHFNNGICSKECTGGFNRLKTATGLDLPVLAKKTSDLSIALKNTANNTVCYVPTERGEGGLNFDINGTTYHATAPDEIVPDGFTGQPD